MNKFNILFGAACISAFSSGSAFSETSSHGVLALLEVNDTTSYDNQLSNFEAKAQAIDCNILREGPVIAEDGDIDFDQPNRFIYLDCQSPLLTTPKGRDLMTELGQESQNITAMEGTYLFHDATSFEKQAGERSYILKVSHYNNTHPNKRDQDLSSLAVAVRPRPDAYQLESFVGVTHAYGMTTPDEAVVLYYDNAAAGDRFRDNNPDILNKLIDFNDKHLTDYIYYFAQSRR